MKPYQPLIERAQRLAESNPDSELTFLNSLLSSLTSHGFASARFYEIVRDPIDNADVLVLRAYAYATAKTKPPVGLRIPLYASTLGTEGLSQDVVLGSPETSPESAKDWIKALGLDKDRWADVAIRDFKGELYGLLAVSVQLEYELTPEDLFNLRVIKNIVAQYESTLRLRQFTKLKKSILAFFKKTEFATVTPEHIAELATGVVLPAVGAQACAVFRYDWPTRRLYKVAEQLDGLAGAPQIPETYFSGQYLTGAAWEDETLRHIPSFARFKEVRSTLVSKDSVEFHDRTIGGINSILYDCFGHRTLRFFVRVINRKENPNLPLIYSHKEALNNVCEELSEFTDEFANRMVIKEFERVSTSGVRHITDYSEPLAKCCDALDAVGFGQCAIIYKSHASPQYELIHCGDNRLRTNTKTKLFLGSESPFLTRIATETGLKISRVSDQRSSTDPFVDVLRSAGAISVISSCSVGDSGAIIATRCLYNTESRLSSGTQLFENPSDKDIIPALLSILSGVIEGSRSNVSADFAETLVAHFGHEVATPLSKLGSKAIAGINRAIKALRDTEIGLEHISKLEEAKEVVDNQSHLIHHQMKSAIALADRSSGSLDVRFEAFRWNTIIDDAWDEAVEWRNSMEGRASFRPAVLTKNPAIALLRSVGDKDLLRAVLSNLFKNAIKYSLPRFGDNKAMEVRILGQPQMGMNIIQVENWGIGIPEDKWELIFQKFIRVERTDRLRAIRGMGLGLYISRLYATAHRGELFCRYSRPTLDDPQRNEQLEGFETSFEMRIPTDQPLGVRKIKISEAGK